MQVVNIDFSQVEIVEEQWQQVGKFVIYFLMFQFVVGVIEVFGQFQDGQQVFFIVFCQVIIGEILFSFMMFINYFVQGLWQLLVFCDEVGNGGVIGL